MTNNCIIVTMSKITLYVFISTRLAINVFMQVPPYYN